MAATGRENRYNHPNFTIKPSFLLLIHVFKSWELISYNNILAVVKI